MYLSRGEDVVVETWGGFLLPALIVQWSAGSNYKEGHFGELRKEEKVQNSCLGDGAWEKIGEL